MFMFNIKKIVVGLCCNVKYSFSIFFDVDFVIMVMEMVDYIFKKIKFISYIVFIGCCLRKRLIFKGF